MITFEQVMEMVRKENEYATRWGKGTRKVSMVEGISDGDVHGGTSGPAGQPFSICDWMCFAKKYWLEADETMQNFTPDGGAVRARLLKVISLLVRCLMIYGKTSDLERIAGHSSSEFPILRGGLKAFDNLTSMREGLFDSDPGHQRAAERVTQL